MPTYESGKLDLDNRRTAVDLSWPHGSAVNDGVSENIYLDSYYYLSYPSSDHSVDKVKQLGPGARLHKVDISRVFCHIQIYPGDIDFLNLKHKSYYLDGISSIRIQT